MVHAAVHRDRLEICFVTFGVDSEAFTLLSSWCIFLLRAQHAGDVENAWCAALCCLVHMNPVHIEPILLTTSIRSTRGLIVYRTICMFPRPILKSGVTPRITPSPTHTPWLFVLLQSSLPFAHLSVFRSILTFTV